MKYRGKRRRLSDRDAEILGTAIQELLEQGLALSPEDLVLEAQKPRSPLHPYFEWDDKAAGHAHRITQARYYLRVIVVEREEVASQVRAFHFVHLEQEGGGTESRWLTLDQALASAEAWRWVCAQELRRLRQCERNLSVYSELGETLPPLREAIKALEERLLEAVPSG